MPKSTHTPEYRVLRELLRELREREGVLQADLAERLGVPQSYVSKSENGERRLDVLEVREWCRGLGVAFVEFSKELDRRLRRLR